METITRQSALHGVKVVDFGWVLAGPLTCKYLSDYGATVICVESLKKPDLLRADSPFKTGMEGNIDYAGYFAFWSANKYSVSLDLTKASGLKVAKKLVAWADIVAENRRPGVMAKIGLAYDVLVKIKPDIIMISSSNQGQTGPFAQHPGLGIHLNGLAGFSSLLGQPQQQPVSLSAAYTDYLSPPLAATALVAALDYRRKTGKGQYIDIAQFEVALQFLGPLILDYFINGDREHRIGNKHSYAVPHGVYRCKGEDRWCAIAVFSDTDWGNFCRVIGNPIWSQDQKLSTLLGRKQNEEELNAWIEEWTTTYSAEEVMSLMQEEGIMAGVVENARDIRQDAQLNERGLFWVMNHKTMGNFTHMGEPSILSKTPAQPRMPSPCLGEHTEYVCKEFLGISEKEFDKLILDGAFNW